MKRTTVLLVILFCARAFAQFGGLPEIAVYLTGNLNLDEKRVLGAKILDAIVKSEWFTADERSSAFMAEIEKEQIAEIVDDSLIRALGKKFGLRYVCIADVATAFGVHQVSARIIDVETAKIGFTGRASGQLNDMESLKMISSSLFSNMPMINSTQKMRTQTTQIQPVDKISQIETAPTLIRPKIAVYVTGDIDVSRKQALEIEMLNAFVKNGRFTIGERTSDFVAAMEGFSIQLRSNVDNISRQGIRFGVQYVCLLNVANMGMEEADTRQISVRMIDVETATIVGRASSHFSNKQNLEAFSNGVVENMFRSISFVSHTGEILIPDFTTSERVFTWFLNTVVCGAGSAIIMKDMKGAGTQWGFLGAGIIVTLLAIAVDSPELALVGAGIPIVIVNPIYNIVRSSTYKKPTPKIAVQHQGLNFTVLPDKNSNLKIYGAYSLSF